VSDAVDRLDLAQGRHGHQHAAADRQQQHRAEAEAHRARQRRAHFADFVIVEADQNLAAVGKVRLACADAAGAGACRQSQKAVGAWRGHWPGIAVAGDVLAVFVDVQIQPVIVAVGGVARIDQADDAVEAVDFVVGLEHLQLGRDELVDMAFDVVAGDQIDEAEQRGDRDAEQCRVQQRQTQRARTQQLQRAHQGAAAAGTRRQ
jgi:hypothetical protein